MLCRPVIVGAPVGEPGFGQYRRLAEPEGETARVVVTAVIVTGQFSLGVAGAAKFSAPDHQCVVKSSRRAAWRSWTMSAALGWSVSRAWTRMPEGRLSC